VGGRCTDNFLLDGPGTATRVGSDNTAAAQQGDFVRACNYCTPPQTLA
jgi:hypothetical protein